MPKILKTDHPTIIARFKSGETCGDIAPAYDCSKARIQQVLKYHGLSGKDGGRTFKPKAAKARQVANKEARIMRDYGVTPTLYAEFTEAVRKAYTVHKCNSARRGIPWEFTLETWANVWEQSGKWDLRGRGNIEGQQRYVLSQPDKSKPIGPDNCAVTTLADALKGRPPKKKPAVASPLATLTDAVTEQPSP